MMMVEGSSCIVWYRKNEAVKPAYQFGCPPAPLRTSDGWRLKVPEGDRVCRFLQFPRLEDASPPSNRRALSPSSCLPRLLGVRPGWRPKSRLRVRERLTSYRTQFRPLAICLAQRLLSRLRI